MVHGLVRAAADDIETAEIRLIKKALEAAGPSWEARHICCATLA